MHRSHRPFGQSHDEIFLLPGAFAFGEHALRLRTLLGSCVAIALWHPRRRIGGMCHYLLPGFSGGSASMTDGRYAGGAFRLFLSEIARHRTRPEDYEATLLGGGKMFESSIGVGWRNIETGRHFLSEHGFLLRGEHVAGIGHRHVTFELSTGQVSLRHVETLISGEVAA